MCARVGGGLAESARRDRVAAHLRRRAREEQQTHAPATLTRLSTLSDDIREAKRLNDYAVATRYVGLAEDVTDADYRRRN